MAPVLHQPGGGSGGAAVFISDVFRKGFCRGSLAKFACLVCEL